MEIVLHLKWFRLGGSLNSRSDDKYKNVKNNLVNLVFPVYSVHYHTYHTFLSTSVVNSPFFDETLHDWV